MRILPFSSLVCVAVLSLMACSKDPAAAPGGEGASASSASTTPSAHGAANAVPGSHEDWCGEHGVAESQCTRCNAKLIPAFKATGDWCPEHGLPESQCLKCNPDLKIVRPPKPASP